MAVGLESTETITAEGQVTEKYECGTLTASERTELEIPAKAG